MSLVNTDTGEVVEAHPTSLIAVSRQCSDIEAWAAECEDVAQLREASNRLAAIDQYLERTRTEGRNRVAAALRRLEVRIGEVLGPSPGHGPGRGNIQHDESLSPQQRSEFRRMAQHADAVEDVIERSDDEDPASRRKVMDEIGARRTESNGDVEAVASQLIDERMPELAENEACRQAARALRQAWSVLKDLDPEAAGKGAAREAAGVYYLEKVAAMAEWLQTFQRQARHLHVVNGDGDGR